MTDDTCKRLTDAERWGLNQEFFDDAIAWHLVELVLPLVGVSPIDHVLDEAQLAWTIATIRDYVDEIDQLFAREQLPLTKRRLTDASAARQKRMFGDDA